MSEKNSDINFATIGGLIGLIFIGNTILAMLIYGVMSLVMYLWDRKPRLRLIVIVVCMGFALIFVLSMQELFSSTVSFRSTVVDILTHTLVEEIGFKVKYARNLSQMYFAAMPLSILAPICLIGWKRWKQRQDKSKHNQLEFPTPILPLWKPSIENQSGAHIGYNNRGDAVVLSDYERGMHTQVIGSTGFGKTVSVVLPLIAADLRQGKAVIFIDGKGDLKAMEDFVSLVRQHGREQDAYIFSPVYPNVSNCWNPLLTGNSIIRKDRLVGAQIWSEEFYKKKAEELLVSVFAVFDDLRITPTFKLLAEFLRNPETKFIKDRAFRNQEVRLQYESLKKILKADGKSYAGIISDINLFCSPPIGQLFRTSGTGDISLYDAIMNRKVVYFHLPVLMMEETTKRIGRMVIHDLKTVCSELQTFVPEEDRMPASVIIDEFASFASENFTELLNKARSAKMGITVIHQSLGDIESVGKEFASQVFENTNIKVILRVDDPATIERYCRMAGTRTEKKYTYQTDIDILGARPSGAASMREVETFNVNPNTLRNLQPGEAVVMIKNSRKVHVTKLNYMKVPSIDLSSITSVAKSIVVPDTHHLVQDSLPFEEKREKVIFPNGESIE